MGQPRVTQLRNDLFASNGLTANHASMSAQDAPSLVVIARRMEASMGATGVVEGISQTHSVDVIEARWHKLPRGGKTKGKHRQTHMNQSLESL